MKTLYIVRHAKAVRRDLPISAFFSMVERNKTLHRTVMQETLGHDHRFLQTVIPYAADIEKMGLHREPVGAFAPRSPGALAYVALWQELQSRLLQAYYYEGRNMLRDRGFHCSDMRNRITLPE